MQPYSIISKSVSLSVAALAAALLISCQAGDRSSKSHSSAEANALAGTWTLTSRIDGKGESQATQRQMKLILEPNSTFQARFRGLPDQDWIDAGQGGFTYKKPFLKFYWESGASVTFLMVEKDEDRMVLHQGRNLVPLKDQEPDEVFVREGAKKDASPAKPS